MATSIVAGFGDVLVAAIAGETWSPKLTVSRKYAPEIVISQTTEAVILTARLARSLTAETNAAQHSRGKRFIDFTYDLLLHSKGKSNDNARVDSLIGLYEEIDDFVFQSVRLMTFESSQAQWLTSAYDPPGEQDEIRTQGLIEIVGSVTYRYER